jgi:hypothetical protein
VQIPRLRETGNIEQFQTIVNANIRFSTIYLSKDYISPIEKPLPIPLRPLLTHHPLSLPRRQNRTKAIPRNLPLPTHLLQHKKLLIRLLSHLPRRLNLRAPRRARARKRPPVIKDLDFMDLEGWRQHNHVEDFVVGGFDGRGADCGGEVLGHEDAGWGVEGEDEGGGGGAEGGFVGFEEGFYGFGVGGHF